MRTPPGTLALYMFKHKLNAQRRPSEMGVDQWGQRMPKTMEQLGAQQFSVAAGSSAGCPQPTTEGIANRREAAHAKSAACSRHAIHKPRGSRTPHGRLVCPRSATVCESRPLSDARRDRSLTVLGVGTAGTHSPRLWQRSVFCILCRSEQRRRFVRPR
eukprot:TRINITY_DN1085_c0_g1_i1.p2 TRINITY_DN1085_c0_g1~~TRINITY_DN1085_c0_g1_i1.p2  ORF type:complete len:158 (+),score=2.85 TRINITY_DN1085_c0_g1_i1:206-679(+)